MTEQEDENGEIIETVCVWFKLETWQTPKSIKINLNHYTEVST